MSQHFALTIRLHEARYHGADEWPPSPARVFQALMAGASVGRRIPDNAARSLTALECLGAPLIAAPAARRGQRVPLFVPNNDLDAVGGDPARVGDVRARKMVSPYLLETESPFLYAWPWPDGDATELLSLANGLYQLGRGVDPAWAVGEMLDDEELAARLRAHRGTIHRPSAGDGATELAVPTRNTFVSLVKRFEASLARLRPSTGAATNFVQPPKAHFANGNYDGTPAFHLFELRSEVAPTKSSPWFARRATHLIEHVRTTAVTALLKHLPDRKEDVERILVGRKPDGTNAGSIAERVRFIPLPSIGHPHADEAIRRVIVQVPPGPLAEADVLWALSGRPLIDGTTGEVQDTLLVVCPPDDMVERYREDSRTWRSVTPLALGSASRRRIDPQRLHEQAKAAAERDTEEGAARRAVAQALRHAQVSAHLVRVHVQREPFTTHGTRAERFAAGTRFPKEALWHVEIELDRVVRGPLVLGDGRFLGLGVMAPKVQPGMYCLHVEGGLRADTDTSALARALRRAVMARVQAVLGRRDENELPSYFHGHAPNEHSKRRDPPPHLAFSVDVPRSRLLIVPPHILPGRPSSLTSAASHLETLERALEGLTELRAGRAGVLSLRAATVPGKDPLCEPSRAFRSLSDYVVTRHPKGLTAEEAIALDVRQECKRRRLPMPLQVRVMRVRGVSRVGVLASMELTFATAVSGPLLLGKTRNLGGGLFEPAQGAT